MAPDSPTPAKVSRKDWVEDKASNSCLICDAKFSFSNRRHHCRSCGILACAKCTSKRMRFEQKRSRVCLTCWNKANLKKKPRESQQAEKSPVDRNGEQPRRSSGRRSSARRRQSRNARRSADQGENKINQAERKPNEEKPDGIQPLNPTTPQSQRRNRSRNSSRARGSSGVGTAHFPASGSVSMAGVQEHRTMSVAEVQEGIVKPKGPVESLREEEGGGRRSRRSSARRRSSAARRRKVLVRSRFQMGVTKLIQSQKMASPVTLPVVCEGADVDQVKAHLDSGAVGLFSMDPKENWTVDLVLPFANKDKNWDIRGSYATFQSKNPVGTEPQVVQDRLTTFMDEEEGRYAFLERVLRTRGTRIHVVVWRMMERPDDNVRPPRLGDLIVCWKPDCVRKVSKLKAVSPSMVERLTVWLKENRLLESTTLMRDAQTVDQLPYEEMYQKTFKRAKFGAKSAMKGSDMAEHRQIKPKKRRNTKKQWMEKVEIKIAFQDGTEEAKASEDIQQALEKQQAVFLEMDGASEKWKYTVHGQSDKTFGERIGEFRTTVPIGAEQDEIQSEIEKLMDDERNRFEGLLDLLQKNQSAISIVLFRLLDAPEDNVRPPRYGDLIVVWSAFARTNAEDRINSLKILTPMMIDLLLAWLDKYKVLKGSTFRRDAERPNQLDYNYIFKKIFQRARIRNRRRQSRAARQSAASRMSTASSRPSDAVNPAF